MNTDLWDNCLKMNIGIAGSDKYLGLDFVFSFGCGHIVIFCYETYVIFREREREREKKREKQTETEWKKVRSATRHYTEHYWK